MRKTLMFLIQLPLVALGLRDATEVSTEIAFGRTRRFYLYADGTMLPVIAGAEDPEPDPEKPDPEKPDPEKPDPEPDPEKPDPEELGEAGKAALKKEREARQAADRQAREALNAHARSLGIDEPEKLSKTKVADEIKAKERARLSENDRLKAEAEEGRKLAAKATEKARRANLITALAEKHNLTGARGKAAARLLDGVEYDDDDEPTNLDDAIEASKAEYGEDSFKGATPGAGNADQGARDGAKKQLSSTEGMTPEEISKALEEGRLDGYLTTTKT